MGRPKLHDEQTREELLRAAEVLVAKGGSEAVSLRRLADTVGTTTRAVYSVFGSKEGLFGALYRRSYRELMRSVEAVPQTGDPRHDLVRVGIDGFRRWALQHPNLFRLVLDRIVPDARPGPEDLAVALQARELLLARVRRCHQAGLLGGRSVEQVAKQFHGICEGLTSFELRTGLWGDADPQAVWEDALAALLAGLEAPPARRRRPRRRNSG
jgi:AcrR family transcriptional regulator